MKAPQGFLPVSISSPDPRGRVDVGSSDAKLLVLDVDPGHAEFMKTACNSHDTLVKALKQISDGQVMDQSKPYTLLDTVMSYQAIATAALAAAGVNP